ncbi:hypothetical protein SAMN05421870_11243 [Streptomyces qinglanensis]|uniref:DUF916 domain-containing protein n=1 Tax=Streptomyces qinglanensis TaxID=943816 RepID=A0A1H9VJ38_9ACTN|nr:hypothetical protein SAMN05421870_11243 [Streptomyces qinglanensis]
MLVWAAVLLWLLGAGGPAAAESGARTGEQWSAAPAPPRGAPRSEARAFFYLEGAPGTVLRDSVALTNDGDAPRTFRLRGADVPGGDGGDGGDGGGRSAERDEDGTDRDREPGAWIAPARDTVEVPPHTRAEVPLNVTVPGGAVPGDHPAALVVDDGKRTERVRMHLRVSGPTLAALSVEDVSVRERPDGSARIGYTLVNRGNTVLRPRLAVGAEGLFGRLHRQPARTLPVELLPGHRLTRYERWPDPPAADLAEVRLTVTAAGGARDSATASYTAVPWGPLLGVLFVLTGGGVGWFARRRRRVPPDARRSAGHGRPDPAPHAAPYPASAGPEPADAQPPPGPAPGTAAEAVDPGPRRAAHPRSAPTLGAAK